MQKLLERVVLGSIILIWISHLVQVFTPEVGFDAVWYHLPVIKAVLEQQKLVFLPDLYQSANPLFSDLIFGIGFFWAKELGTKVVAYLFGLILVVTSYFLSKKLVGHFWSLIIVLVISTYQVVAWQSASFYIDVAKATWEILTLLCLFKWREDRNNKLLVISGLTFGASLATKLFSLFLLPLFLGLVWLWSQKKKIKSSLSFLLSSLVLPSPFYLWSFINTGIPFYSFSQHLIKLGEIGGESSLGLYLLERSSFLLTLPSEIIFGRDYTSFLLILFLPIVLWSFKSIIQNKRLLGLAIFTVWQTGLWWYLPPLSTRYALSGFIVWIIISIWSVRKLIDKNDRFFKPVLISILLSVMINFIPRIGVNLRSLRYLNGQQNKQQYIHQFFDGNIDRHLINWYQLD